MNKKSEQDKKEESLIYMISKRHRRNTIKIFFDKLKREHNEIIPIKNMLLTDIYLHIIKTNLKIFIINVFTLKSSSQLKQLSINWNYTQHLQYFINRLLVATDAKKRFKQQIRIIYYHVRIICVN